MGVTPEGGGTQGGYPAISLTVCRRGGRGERGGGVPRGGLQGRCYPLPLGQTPLHTKHQQNKHNPDTITQWVGHENPAPTRRCAELSYDNDDEITESVVIPLDDILSSDSSEDENTDNDSD